MENDLSQIFLSDNSSEITFTGGLILESILNIQFNELFFISIYFILFIIFMKFFIKKHNLNKNKVYFLISYHYIFVILAYIYSLIYVNDLDSFFQAAYLHRDFSSSAMANRNMILINHYLIHILNLHYFSIFIFLGFFSSLGFLLLFISFNELLSKFQFNNNLLFGLFLIPSWHFFSSFPGKDGIILFGIGLLSYCIIKKNFLFMVISIILIFLVRPQVSFVILVTGLFVFIHYFLILKLKKKIFYPIGLISITVLFLFLLKNFSPLYFGHIINFFEIGSTVRNYDNNFSGWYETNSNILLNSFKYILYPLFDFSTVFRAGISVENILILFLILKAISNFNRERFLKIVNEKQIVFSFVFFIIMLILLSNLTANIGITSRHKWMIMPFLFLFLVPFLSKFKSNKL
ncbi:hypothetical protein N9337_06670 [Candidatus Pelagibacter sp.]|nr:hypothetical protein [Candidatus Pelagibacter sp.]